MNDIINSIQNEYDKKLLKQNEGLEKKIAESKGIICQNVLIINFRQMNILKFNNGMID